MALSSVDLETCRLVGISYSYAPLVHVCFRKLAISDSFVLSDGLGSCSRSTSEMPTNRLRLLRELLSYAPDSSLKRIRSLETAVNLGLGLSLVLPGSP
jgi:hypothetical protein